VWEGNVSGENQACGANYGNSHLDRRIRIQRLWRGGLLICKKPPASPLMRPCVFAINPPPSQQASTHRTHAPIPPPFPTVARPPLEPRPRAAPGALVCTPLLESPSAAPPPLESAPFKCWSPRLRPRNPRGRRPGWFARAQEARRRLARTQESDVLPFL
jgi:hypothetical protein